MFEKKAFYTSLVIILITIKKIQSTSVCSVFRNARDNITPVKCLLPANNVCQSLGAMVKDPRSCKCICPRFKGTYMENTQRCTAKNDVWSGCSVTLRGPTWSIPVFPLKSYVTAEVILPSKLTKCKISIDKTRSSYLNITGWKQFDAKKGFPFALSYERRSRKIKLQWTKSGNHVNSIVRLQINGCRKTDCLLFKVFTGRINYPCTLPTPTSTTPKTTTTTTTYPATTNVWKNLSSYINVTMPPMSSQKPTVVADKDKHGSSSDGASWVIIGPIIGVITVLTVCIIVMVFCFWRIWKKKLKNNSNYNSAMSSISFLPNSTPSSSQEVAYTAPHLPYQDLKPPIRGFPPGVYQSLNKKSKEDASGYMLPTIPTAETSRDPDPEPIYNEIGSPRTLPTYDYALPEDAVRLSIHSLNDNITNDPAYIGRSSKEQQGPNSNGTPKGVYTEPVQNGPSDEVGEPGYLELNNVDSVDSRKPAVINTYQEPRPWRTKGHNQGGLSGEGQGGPSTSGPYQALQPPRYEPLRLSPTQRSENDSTTA